MKRILYIAMADIHSQSGGGFANRAFYESLLLHYPGNVDIVQFAENVRPEDSNSYGVPSKNSVGKFIDLTRGKIHRFSPWLISFLKEHEGKYSCCIINSGILGDIVHEIKHYTPNLIFIHHNDEAVFQLDNNRPTTLFGLTPSFVDKNQKKAYDNASLNLFLTEYDKKLFEKKYGNERLNENVVIGVYETSAHNVSFTDNHLTKNVLAITGALHNVQTIKGIKDLFTHYIQIIDDFYSGDYNVIISGRNPGKYIRSLQSNNVQIEANPTDMSAVIARAGIFVCPIHVGSGLKLRIMDGLKMGMPILTHEVSSHGYEYYLGNKWFQVYNDRESFERGLKNINEAIVQEPKLKKIIYEEYLKYFSFEEGDKRFINAIETFVE